MREPGAARSGRAARQIRPKANGSRSSATILEIGNRTHATERARLRGKERRRRRTKEVAFAFRTFRPCVTRHKRGTKQQDGKREKAQGKPQRSKGGRMPPPRLSRAKVAQYRQRSGWAGTAAEWRQREPRRPGDTKQNGNGSSLRGKQWRA
jgi:hypothetical protein